MTEHGSASDMSEVEPSPAPALCATKQNGDSDMAALDLSEQRAPLATGQNGASDMADQLQEPGPSGRQIGDEPIGDQPTDGDPSVDINAEKLIAEVQKCPLIYNEDFYDYYNEQETQKQWLHICERLFPEWYTFNPRKMTEIAIRVQANWAKLRKPLFKKYIDNGGVRKHVAAVKIKLNTGMRGFITKLTYLAAENYAIKLDESSFGCEVPNQTDLLNINQEILREFEEICKESKQENARDEQLNPQEATHDNIQNNSSATPSTFAQNHKVQFPNVESAMPSTSAQNYKVQFPNIESAMPSTSAQNYKVQFPNVESAMPSTSAQNHKVQFPNVESAMPSTSAQNHKVQFPNEETAMPSTSAHNNIVPLPNVEPAMPSTSAHNDTGQFPNMELVIPSTSAHITHLGNIVDNHPQPSFDYSRVPIKPGSVEHIAYLNNILSQPLPPTSARISPNINVCDYVPPELGPYKNAKMSFSLYHMLTFLDYDQQRAVWPKLVDLITEAGKKKVNKPTKIKILQGELLTDDSHSSDFVATTGPFLEPEQLLAQETLVEPELAAQNLLAASELSGQETLAELEPEEAEEEPTYPSYYGRPINAQGEIIYPETDNEDLDD